MSIVNHDFIKLTVIKVGDARIIGEKPEEGVAYVRKTLVQSVQEPDKLDKRYGINALVTYGDFSALTYRVKESVAHVLKEMWRLPSQTFGAIGN